MFRSSFLFSQPSFIEGMARIFDFGCSIKDYNFSQSPDEADDIAMSNDWNAIYEDFESAFKIIERKQLNEQTT